MKYYRTQRICAKEIGVELDENNIIREVEFCGGCEGNTQGLQNLLVGMNIKKLQGINCGRKGTSCPDQLAQILKSL